MKKLTIISLAATLMLAGACIVPAVASAQSISVSASVSGSSTISNLEAQITALVSQLTTLRAQLSAAEGSSTAMSMPMCPAFARNLSIGSQGSDVSELQTMLAQDPDIYPQGAVTGYFGPLTAAAVTRFQEVNGIASSSSATGFFGPLTRNFIGQHCGMMPMPTPIVPPVIYNETGTTMISPSSGPVGTTVTISGVSGSGELGTMQTVFMGGLVAAQDVSVTADGSLTFTVPQSLAPQSLVPDCQVGEACPQFLEVTTPRAYTISLGQSGNNSTPTPVGIFTVTENGSSSIPGPTLPL
jgi:peptidoglycan hydrolase-like protein with peptidoglycan-binding domain